MPPAFVLSQDQTLQKNSVEATLRSLPFRRKTKRLAADEFVRLPYRRWWRTQCLPVGRDLLSGAGSPIPQGGRTVTLLRLRPLFTCQRSARRRLSYAAGPRIIPERETLSRPSLTKFAKSIQTTSETALGACALDGSASGNVIMGPITGRETGGALDGTLRHRFHVL